MRIVFFATILFSVVRGKTKNDGGVRCDDPNLSAKARRHFCSDSTTLSSTTASSTEVPAVVLEDPDDDTETVEEFFADDEEEYHRQRARESFFVPEEPITHVVTVSTTPSNFLDEDAEPFCSDLMPGFDDMTNCRNKTEPDTEVRWRDTVIEKLINQSWRDIQEQVNRRAEVGGIILDPLEVDTLANIHPLVDISESTIAYSANLKMWGIQVHGLSTIYANQILVTRAQNLFDIDVKVELKFSRLSMNGTYSLTGSLGGWFGTSFTSDGDRPFFVDIEEATITMRVRLDTTDNKELECGRVGDVLITNIGIPFTYDDISINFENLGYTYNTVINGLSIFILKTQEKTLLSLVKDKIRSTVHSLIC